LDLGVKERAMRTFVHFDLTGAIHAFIAVDAAEGVNAGLVPQPGMSVTEVEGLNVKLDESNVEAASDIAKKYKVATSSERPVRLVEK
jgi:hypothetical protein